LEKEAKEREIKIALLGHLIKEKILKNNLSKNTVIRPTTKMNLQENYMNMFS